MSNRLVSLRKRRGSESRISDYDYEYDDIPDLEHLLAITDGLRSELTTLKRRLTILEQVVRSRESDDSPKTCRKPPLEKIDWSNIDDSPDDKQSKVKDEVLPRSYFITGGHLVLIPATTEAVLRKSISGLSTKSKSKLWKQYSLIFGEDNSVKKGEFASVVIYEGIVPGFAYEPHTDEDSQKTGDQCR